jgi:hypothetical protein
MHMDRKQALEGVSHAYKEFQIYTLEKYHNDRVWAFLSLELRRERRSRGL